MIEVCGKIETLSELKKWAAGQKERRMDFLKILAKDKSLLPAMTFGFEGLLEDKK
jgi:hypothetical protein